jgi:hypothetical protein
MLNEAQVKSAVRWLITTAGGFLTGYVVSRGWLTAEQVSSIMSSELVLGIIALIGSGVWGLISKTAPALVTQVERLPQVAGVVTTPTPEGRQLAEAVPSPNVAPATSPLAAEIAGTRP